MNPLDQLRDIHMPASVEWWPLAIGWWIVLALLIALLAAFLWRRNKNKNQRLMVNHALDSLEQLEANTELNSEEWLQSLSALIRRIAINFHGREATAGIVGNQWLEYLDQHSKGNNFSEGVGQLLASQPYRQSVNYDRKAVAGLVRSWVKSQSGKSPSKMPLSKSATPSAKSKPEVSNA